MYNYLRGETMKEITMLGTGNAAVRKCFNTCFAIREGGEFFLVDAGGGNGIMRQLAAAGLDFTGLRGMFVTHAHTDHILGAVWVVRMMQDVVKKPGHPGLDIWCHDEVAEALRYMCDHLLANGSFGWAGGKIRIREVLDGESFDSFGIHFTVFDILSTKKKQFGFRAELDGKVLVCLGDEPYNPNCDRYVHGADLLMSESFCLHADEARFHAHEKHHSTAKEAAALATTLGAKKLLIYHTEETDLPHRRERYTAEAAQEFRGPILVPDDLETISI